MEGAALVAAALLSLAAGLFALAMPETAWAEDEVCAYAYLDPLSAQDETYRLVLQESQRNQSITPYHYFGPVPADGCYDGGDVGEPPWQDFSWLDDDEGDEGDDDPQDGVYPRIVEVSIVGTVRPRVTYAWFSGIDCQTIDLSAIDFSQVTDMSAMFSDSGITSVSFAGADLSRVELADSLFAGCENLRELDLSDVNMPSVRNAWGMFSNCPALESVTLPSFGPQTLEDVGCLFSECESLERADLNGLTVSPSIADEDAEDVFSGCSRLSEVTTGVNLTNSIVFESLFESGTKLWKVRGGEEALCNNASEIVGYLRNATGTVTFDAVDNAPVIVAVEDVQSKTMHIRSGEQQLGANEVELGRIRNDEATWSLNPACAQVETVVVDETVRPSSLRGWFSGFGNLKSVRRLDRIDTANVQDFSYMFAGCASLTSLNLSSLNVQSATDLSHFLEGCTSLATVTLPDSGTPHAEDLSCMFSDCSSLVQVDVGSLDLSSAVDLSYLFSGCSRLKTLANTGVFAASENARFFQSMFADCEALEEFDLSVSDTSNVSDMSSMFSRCTSLRSFELSGIDTGRLRNASSMFYCCTGLTEFTFGNVNLSGASIMGGMLWGCTSLTTIHVSSNTRFSNSLPEIVDGTWRSSADGELYREGWFPSRKQATYTREGGEEAASYVYGVLDRATGAFSISATEPAGDDANEKLYRIDIDREYDGPADVPWHADRAAIKSANVGVVACSMSYWFCDCPALQSVRFEGSGWIELEAMSMFARCPKLTTVTFDGSSLRSAHAEEMFANCTALQRIELPAQSSISNAERMFAGCTALVDADLSNVTFANSVVATFDGCTVLESVKLPQRVGSPSVANLFRSCSSLQAVDLSTIDTSYPTTDFSGMFYGCRSLASVDLSSFDTSRARSLKRMFHGCRSLQTVTLGKRFTFRGVAFSRLAGSELPLGAWQQDGGDALRAYASDSLPDFKEATYRKVDETTPGLVIESVRGDTEAGSAKYKIETTIQEEQGELEAVNTYILDEGYASNVFILGEAAKASSTKTLTNKTVSKQTVNNVSSKKVTSIIIGPQVGKIKARAFEGAPKVTSLTVKSDKLTTAASVRNCLAGSHVSRVSYSIKTTAAKGLKVKKAFETWAGKKKK